MWCGVSDELLEDSMVPLAAYFRDIFGEAFGYQFDKEVLQGSGSPHTGILTAAGKSLGLGAGQTSFQDINLDDMYDAVAKLSTVNARTGGKWMIHCTVFDILRKLKDANGNYIYQQPNGTQPGSLCGYPYIISDGMVSVSDDAKSKAFIAFGNPKGYLWGNRTQIEFKVFDQTTHAVEYDEVLFRGRVRWAFGMGLANTFVAISTAAS
jgi:HK97 family phage major capsid protein